MASRRANAKTAAVTPTRSLARRDHQREDIEESGALLLHLGEEFGQGRTQRRGELLHNQDGGHALTAFQQSDVVAVQVGLGGQGFLGQAGSLALPAKDDPKLALEWMHGTSTEERCQCNPAQAFHLHTIMCKTVVFQRLGGYANNQEQTTEPTDLEEGGRSDLRNREWQELVRGS